MNKTELIAVAAEKAGLSKKDTERHWVPFWSPLKKPLSLATRSSWLALAFLM